MRIEGETGRVTDSQIVLPEFDTVLDYVNAAIRDGLASDGLCGYLQRMGFDVDNYEPITHEGAADTRGGMTPDAARDRRLEYAERLARDVRTARTLSVD